MKRVFIIHGWGGNPEEPMLQWIKNQLELKEFEVEIPVMPNAEEPIIEEWISFLNSIVENPDSEIFFIGHSIGCQAIMRYLEQLDETVKVGGAVFIAGWFNLQNLETEEEKEIAREWEETSLNIDLIKKHTDNFTAIFSDNDPFVPLSDAKLFKEKLSAKIIIEHGKFHFDHESGIFELPIVVEEILRMSIAD